VATISLSLFEDLHHYFVSHSYSAAMYAIYAVGCLQIPFLGAIRDAIGQLMILRVSELQKISAHREIMDLTFRVARKLALMYLAVYAFFIVFGHDVLVLLYTRKYEDSWPIFALYLTQVLLGIVMYDPIFRAYSSHRYFVLTVRAVLLAILVPALWAGLRLWGLMGAVGAVITVHFVERCLCYYRVIQILNIRRADLKGLADIPKIAAVAGVSVLTAAAIRAVVPFPHPALMLGVCGIIFGCVYAAGIWMFSLIEVEEKDHIRRLLRFRQRAVYPVR
jgi:O-antigen/teichoic acid export membrane protein